ELSRSNGHWSLRRAGAAIPLRALQDVPELARTRQVTLGIRPEDVSLVGEPSAEALAARVALVEPLGDATVVTLDVCPPRDGEPTDSGPPFTLVSKTEPRAEVRPGGRVSVVLDAERAHLFDPET